MGVIYFNNSLELADFIVYEKNQRGANTWYWIRKWWIRIKTK